MASVGQLLRQAREARGLTLAALAERIGATKSYLSMIENHRVGGPPSTAVLEALEHALGIEDGQLLRAAAWQNTPASVREDYQRQVELARQGAKLASLLKGNASKTGGDQQKARQQQVRKLVNATLRAARNNSDSAALPRGGRTSVPLINKVAAGYPKDFTDLDYPARVADEYVPTFNLNDPDAFALRVVGDSMQPNYLQGDIIIFSPRLDVVDGDDCLARLDPDHSTTFKRVFFEDDNVRLQPLNPAYAPMVVARDAVLGLYKAVQRIQQLG